MLNLVFDTAHMNTRTSTFQLDICVALISHIEFVPAQPQARGEESVCYEKEAPTLCKGDINQQSWQKFQTDMICALSANIKFQSQMLTLSFNTNSICVIAFQVHHSNLALHQWWLSST